MLDDQQLLRRYTDDASEAAFGELVARHVNLVYSVALRRTGGDTHLAQDAAQLVFTDLARKARSLPAGVVLVGWLHRATHYAAAQLLRTERRRVEREQEAVAMNTLESEPASDWEQIRPLLDEALDELGRDDRDALLLRYFEQRSLAEVGNALGSNEDAARKRVTRALEKLRSRLTRRGVTTSVMALSTTLPLHAIQAAPAGLAATLANASLAGAAAGTGTTLTLLKLMATTKLKAGIVSAMVVASVATSVVIQHQSQTKMRAADVRRRQQADQLARLQAENENFANLAAQTGSPNQLNDLLRLRGEVGLLRKQTNDLATLQEENRRLRARNSLRSDETKPILQQKDEQRENAIAKMNYTRTWLLAFFEYAEKHQSQFPADFEQAALFLSGDASSVTNVTTDQFEIAYQGSRDAITNPPNVIVLREKEAQPSVGGGWHRAYGFADGHSEIHFSQDGSFDEWEKQRGATPAEPPRFIIRTNQGR